MILQQKFTHLFLTTLFFMVFVLFLSQHAFATNGTGTEVGDGYPKNHFLSYKRLNYIPNSNEFKNSIEKIGGEFPVIGTRFLEMLDKFNEDNNDYRTFDLLNKKIVNFMHHFQKVRHYT